MIVSFGKIPYLLLVLLQLCCISNLFVIAAVPPKGPPKSAPKASPAKLRGDKSTPGAGGSGWHPPPNNPLDRIGGGRPQPRPAPPRPGPVAPLPVWKMGDVIGARAKYYEANSKVTTMHPGVIVAGPDPNGNFRVAMISNKLLGNGPRQPATKYLGAGIDGEISLGMPIVISGQHLRPWRRPGLGNTPPVQPAKLAELKRDITFTKDPADTGTNGYARLARRGLDLRTQGRRLARRAIRGT
ncbi:hypothetical protein BKA70DRAFT_1221635 [Coprinopsis sp. MPI-PUGE-AT-0042]|nr:hypothetical protein BKA70DRAFT_1221635 [Coprinopsis sp. MPI-PUGE-AT-0042]